MNPNGRPSAGPRACDSTTMLPGTSRKPSVIPASPRASLRSQVWAPTGAAARRSSKAVAARRLTASPATRLAKRSSVPHHQSQATERAPPPPVAQPAPEIVWVQVERFTDSLEREHPLPIGTVDPVLGLPQQAAIAAAARYRLLAVGLDGILEKSQQQ